MCANWKNDHTDSYKINISNLISILTIKQLKIIKYCKDIHIELYTKILELSIDPEDFKDNAIEKYDSEKNKILNTSIRNMYTSLIQECTDNRDCISYTNDFITI